MLALSMLASAGTAASNDLMVWNCWYEADGAYRLTCDLPDTDLVWQPVDDGSSAEGLRAQWRSAISARRTDIAAQLVRNHPAEFAAYRVYIPLYGPPDEDLRQAERLARAVLCRRVAGCSVAFDRSPVPGKLR